MSRGKILVVDDDEIVLAGHQEILREHGYDVKRAQCGKEAVEMAKKETFDVIFIDLVMPGMDGAEICKLLKETKPDIPVACITGKMDADLTQREDNFMCAGGLVHYLYKPLSPEEIVEAVDEILTGKGKK